MRKVLNFINGEFSPALSGETLEHIQPATGLVDSLVASSDEKDLELAVSAAQRAFPAWSQLEASQRAEYLLKIAERIGERLEEFALAESEDQGKPLWLARQLDIPRVQDNFRFFAHIIHGMTSDASQMNQAINYTLRQPVGVAGLISPWNLPLYLLTWKIAPALITGNTVVAKPSELTSRTAHLLGEVMQEVALPPGVCNILMGLGSKIGRAIVRHPQIPLISFTGGTQTAQSLIQDAAPHFKKLSLELGGKNPNIIFADCDFEKCLESTLRSSFLNQGEICLCGSRIFVERPIFEMFKTEFVKRTSQLTVGDPKNEKNFMGALVSQPHLQKVMGFIEEAKNLGGEILTGGVPPELPAPFDKGYFLRPTIITGLDTQCSVMQEEIFGPVVTLTAFDSEQEVLEMANDVKYGLSATLWTQNLPRAHRMSEQLKAGQIWVNTWLKRDLRTPFGGVKQSGVGREGGQYSLEFFTEAKNVCISFDKEPL